MRTGPELAKRQIEMRARVMAGVVEGVRRQPNTGQPHCLVCGTERVFKPNPEGYQSYRCPACERASRLLKYQQRRVAREAAREKSLALEERVFHHKMTIYLKGQADALKARQQARSENPQSYLRVA